MRKSARAFDLAVYDDSARCLGRSCPRAACHQSFACHVDASATPTCACSVGERATSSAMQALMSQMENSSEEEKRGAGRIPAYPRARPYSSYALRPRSRPR